MAATVSNDERPRSARKRAERRRWVREVQGIAALVVAGFGVVALATFDPRQTPARQESLAGPVGLWLAWGLFQAFGYAGVLLPILLGAWGASAFLRHSLVRGALPVLGLAGLLVTASGLLALAVPGNGVEYGGLVGWGLTRALRGALGTAGAWLVLVAALPTGLLLVTQVSYAAICRALASRLARQRRQRARASGTVASPLVSDPGDPGVAIPVQDPGEPAPPLVVVEPSRPRSGLMERGLAWQETFDFGKGGAESFQLPPVGLLKLPSPSELRRTREELQENAETLRRKLEDFEVEGRIVQVSPGPVITSYEFEPAPGVKISRVVNLADDLALALKAAAVRIVGPIPGRGTVAIEVPNPEPATVYLREIFSSTDFAESKKKLLLALGKDVTGGPVVADLAAMPHLLVAGATGSGKSVGLNGMICSILYKMTPAEVRFLMIDPKRLELSVYEGIPHLLAPVVTDAKEAAARLRWIVGKMDERYKQQ